MANFKSTLLSNWVVGNFLQRSWKCALVLCALLLGVQTASYASHAMGADISYRCLGNNQYEVTVTFYRDCSGIPAPASMALTAASASCGITLPTITATQAPGSGVEVSQLCPAQLSQSRCNSTSGTLQGVRVYYYVATVTLPQTCTDWIVGASESSRNSGVTNLVGSSGYNLYVDTRINNTICNNSPSFTSRPVPYICGNQPFTFNHGAIDVDGDSLYYQIVPTQGDATTVIPYVAGFSTSYPLATSPANTFSFNTSTGQMSFTPANTAQVATITMKVFEIRNGDTIGYVMRDIQVVVMPNCTNAAVSPTTQPTVQTGGSFDTTSRSFVVCQNSNLYFSLYVKDPNPTDTLRLDSLNTNLFQVFGAGNFAFQTVYPVPGRYDTMRVDFFIRGVNSGRYQFTIGFTDNACPIPSTPVLGFNIVIPGVEIEAQDTVICPGIAQNIPLRARTFSTATGSVPGVLAWQQIDGPTAPLSSTTSNNPIAAVPATTVNGDSIVYEVTFTTVPDPTTGSQCITRDTVKIYLRSLPLSVNTLVSDTTLCQNGLANAISFNTTATGPGINLTDGIYSWTTIPAGRTADMSSTSVRNPTANVIGAARDSISYIVQYAYGSCVGRDTVKVRFNPGHVVVNPATVTACAGDTVQLSAVLSDTSIVALPVVCTDYTVSQIPYTTFTGGTPTSLTLSDDQLSGAIPIGFPFVFMCDTVTQLYISSNGFVTFNSASGSGCCSGQVLPNISTPNSVIALAWTDLNPATAGTINYSVLGASPNRQMVISYNGVANFGSGGSPLTGQIVIYEGSNNIEIYTGSYGNDGGLVTQGIENAAGTFGYAVSGRNGVDWSATTSSAYRFTPVIPFYYDPITYAWSPGAGLTSTTISNPRAIAQSNMTYMVSVMEGSCAMWDSVRINITTALPAPTITCGSVANSATEIAFNWGGVAGATGWEYSRDSGRTWIATALADSTVTFSNLLNGSCIRIYVRATGGSGPCPRNASGSFVCCTSPCSSNITITPVSISCAGLADGALNTIATGGTLGAPYTLSIFNAATNTQVGASVRSNGTALIGGTLAAGTYYVRAVDSFGCLGTSSTVTITMPSALDASYVTVTNALCFGTATGTATATATGGTSPYTYAWSNAAGQTTATATGLAAGTYHVTATDARGCTDTVRNFVIRNPFAQAPNATITTTVSNSCPVGNGTATLQTIQNMTGNPTPGQPNSFQYAWSNGQMNTTQATGLNAGSYQVTITDANGCRLVETFNIQGTTLLVNGFGITQPTCGVANGSISVTVANGVAPYSYQWSSNANGQTSAAINNLASGTYSVTVTDANGCHTNGTAFLNANNLQLSITNREERVACFGDATGFIDITATTNAPAAVSYSWSNGATSQDIYNLPAGVYTVTASIQSGTATCSSTIAMTVLQPTAPLNSSLVLVRDLDCTGQPVGQLRINGVDGWGAYQFRWENGTTTNDRNNLAAGTYTVTVTDAEGCTVSSTTTLVQPQVVTLDAYIGAPGLNTFSVLEQTTNIPISGGTAQTGVTYTWTPNTNIANPSAISTTVDGITAGTYVYTISGQSADCQTTDSVTLVVVAAAMRGMPTAFSPNGDGDNDYFRPVQANNIEVVSFKIYNRWGQLLYDTKDYSTGWDGKHNGEMQPRDAYIYIFEYRLPTRTEITQLRGEFTLLR